VRCRGKLRDDAIRVGGGLWPPLGMNEEESALRQRRPERLD
jgi:hypothetical protein